MEQKKKKVSVLIPCYNEQENVVPMSEAITDLFEKNLTKYDWELVFIDNDSSDNTRVLLREIINKNQHIKAIFNAKNFGQFNSPYYGLLQTTGDCTIGMVCDFQDPISLIPEYLKEWENGYEIVIGIKTNSEENPLIYHARSIYYKFVKKFSDVDQIEHFTGSGLYDKSFINVLRELHDPTPFLRGIVAELGYKIKKIPYTQPKRMAGKSHNNFFTLYDAAMLSITSYTKIGLRICSFMGAIVSVICFIIAIVYLVMKLIHWHEFNAGMAPMIISMLFLGGIIIFSIGFMGEYIMSINKRVMDRPLVIEEERIGKWDEDIQK